MTANEPMSHYLPIMSFLRVSRGDEIASGGKRFDSGGSAGYPDGITVCTGGLHDRAFRYTRNADRDSFLVRG